MYYVELIEGGLHNRNKIVTTNEIKNITGTDCYRSLFIYTKELQDYVKQTGSVAKYSGYHSADAIIVDFDGDIKNDFNQVRKEVHKFIEFLNHHYDVDPKSLYIAFSGNKGFHVVIPVQVIGGIPDFREDFYQLYKEFVGHVTEGFRFVDLSIYNPMRVMRIVNTKHSESGLYKIPISFTELKNQNFNVHETAKHTRNLDDRLPPSEIEESRGLKSIWDNLSKLYDIDEIKKDQKIAHDSEFQQALKKPASTGGRHEALSKIAGYLIDKNVGFDQAYAMLQLWDEKNDPPLGDRLKVDLKGMYNSYWDRRPQAEVDEATPIENLIVCGGGYTDAYNKHIARISKFGRIKFGYDVIDDPIRGMIGGEVGVIAGKTSVGKSALAQNIGLNNNDIGRRTLFFSLEMPIATVAERNLQIKLNKSGRHIEELRMKGDPFIEEDIAKANEQLDNFVTLPVQGISYPLIEKYIYDTEDFFGEKIDLVIIDYAGLIKFEGGSLYEQQSGIAKDLKAMAGRTDTAIITLAQVSKQYKDTDPLDLDATRDSGVVVEASDYYLGIWRANRELNGYVCIDGSVLKNRNGSRVEFSAKFSKTSLLYTVSNRVMIKDQETDDDNPF